MERRFNVELIFETAPGQTALVTAIIDECQDPIEAAGTAKARFEQRFSPGERPLLIGLSVVWPGLKVTLGPLAQRLAGSGNVRAI